MSPGERPGGPGDGPPEELARGAAAAGEIAAPVKIGSRDEYRGSALELQVTQLMSRTKAGDALAFDELVGLLRTRAFHLARALVGSREDALDLCQEAFLKTYRARQSFRDDQAFLPWFHRILRNTCFSHLRRYRRIRSLSLSGSRPDEDDGEWVLEGNAPDPSAGIEAEEQSLAFQRVFETLKATDREILALRHFEELSYREIAERLAIPQGTVMSRLFHARRRLRAQLSLPTGPMAEAAPAGDDERPPDRQR